MPLVEVSFFECPHARQWVQETIVSSSAHSYSFLGIFNKDLSPV